MKNVWVFQIKGSTLKFNVYRIQAKAMEVIWTMKDVKLADISGKKKAYLKAKIEELENKIKIENIREAIILIRVTIQVIL